MSITEDGDVPSVWKSQPLQTISISPEQMRSRAARFEAQTNRRNRSDLASFVVLFLMTIGGMMVQKNMLTRAGIVLTALWALVGIYSVRRYHRLAAPGTAEAMGATGATWYRQQLERQRDVASSRPWGIALAAPGVCLLLMGYVDAGAPRNIVAILAGVAAFAGIVGVIHGRILAGRCQLEINQIRAME